MSQQFLENPKPYTAGSDLLQYRVVKYVAGQSVSYAGQGDDVLGVVLAGQSNGQYVAIQHKSNEGTVKVTVSSAVADGDKLWPTGAVGMLTNSGSGPAAYIACEASSASGDIIEARAIGTAGVDANGLGNGASGGNDGVVPVLYQLLGVTATAGTYAIATLKRKMNIVNWWVIARDVNAANVKIQNGVTDASAVIAKGTVTDTIVPGGTIVAAQKTIAAGTVLNVVSSANATFDVFVQCTPTA
jgi:hypothetical protein